MSKSSIYETNWIDLVFENKNKEYGAYVLRKENAKTSFFALGIGVLLCATLIGAPKAIGLFYNHPALIIETVLDPIEKIIQITPITLATTPPQMPAVKAAVAKVPDVAAPKLLANPTIVKADLATPDSALNKEVLAMAPTATDATGAPTLGSLDSGGTAAVTAPTDYGNTLVSGAVLDKLPEFPGGIEAFYRFIAHQFVSPEIYGTHNIRIYVSFVIEKDGSMTAIQVMNNPGYGLDKEAIRVLKAMKMKWSPAMVGSKAVRTAYNLPITVQLH
ncbi:energy transducer TonB [Flavobacterium crassostreae]|uniref:Ferric siderophore ABC transporter substrate-binding protein n=1 Tax=Flavobacterium crassostreae TaxID=1763534 RepID=A0A1B9E3I2_9FLAO|nr:energy transducer TonB [Flavobacterium crassostreae]OCB76495.1 ferric siderophore ABC transporter substrate-binding protein [Flavobacterium crassostreae]